MTRSKKSPETINVGEWRPVKRRLIEVAAGLAIVLVAIVISRFWIEIKNADRADSMAFRRCLALTLDAAGRFQLIEDSDSGSVAVYREFLDSPEGQPLPLRPTHEFVDSFLVYYQDGILDSLEADALYRRVPRLLAGEE